MEERAKVTQLYNLPNQVNPALRAIRFFERLSRSLRQPSPANPQSIFSPKAKEKMERFARRYRQAERVFLFFDVMPLEMRIKLYLEFFQEMIKILGTFDAAKALNLRVFIGRALYTAFHATMVQNTPAEFCAHETKTFLTAATHAITTADYTTSALRQSLAKSKRHMLNRRWDDMPEQLRQVLIDAELGRLRAEHQRLAREVVKMLVTHQCAECHVLEDLEDMESRVAFEFVHLRDQIIRFMNSLPPQERIALSMRCPQSISLDGVTISVPDFLAWKTMSKAQRRLITAAAMEKFHTLLIQDL